MTRSFWTLLENIIYNKSCNIVCMDIERYLPIANRTFPNKILIVRDDFN